MAVRVAVMRTASGTSPLRSLDARTVWAAVGLMGRHARLFFWAHDLSFLRAFELTASLRSPWPWAALLVFIAVCLGRKREPLLSFLVLWWFVTLLPSLDYHFLSIPLVADRFSYLPSVGLCLAIAHLAFVRLPKLVPQPSYQLAAAGIVAGVACLWAAQTARAIPHWRDDESLTNNAFQASPQAAEVHTTRGMILQLRDGDLAGAEREFQTALRLNAQSIRPAPSVTYDAYIGLGQVALLQGRQPEALAYFEKAVHLMPNSTAAYKTLGSVYFPRGEYARAADYFQQAVRANPLDTEARFFLGTCWMKMGKPGQAADQFHAARDVDPAYLQAWAAEAAALDAAGDRAGAARVRREMGPR